VDEASELRARDDGQTFHFSSERYREKFLASLDHCRRRDEPEFRLGDQQRLAAVES
jgi:YHS domain-containing protein